MKHIPLFHHQGIITYHWHDDMYKIFSSFERRDPSQVYDGCACTTQVGLIIIFPRKKNKKQNLARNLSMYGIKYARILFIAQEKGILYFGTREGDHLD